MYFCFIQQAFKKTLRKKVYSNIGSHKSVPLVQALCTLITLLPHPQKAILPMIKWQIVQRVLPRFHTRAQRTESQTAGGHWTMLNACCYEPQEKSVLIWHLKGHHCAPACEILLVWLIRRVAGKSDIRAESHPQACWFLCSKPLCVYVSCLGYNS